MKLTPPKAITFWISVILVVIGVIGFFIFDDAKMVYSLVISIIGYVLLAFGNILKRF